MEAAPAPPTPSRRLACALGAVGTLAAGAAAAFVLVVVDDETRASGAFGGAVPFSAFVLVAIATALGFGALVGLAVVPAAVVARRQRRRFAAAVALAAVALLLALPSPLALFSWPLAALSAVASFVLFRRTRRPAA